jgi:hypothetical protein
MKATNGSERLESSVTLSPFIRTGLDGGCVACFKPVTDHVDQRGHWLGCKGAKINVPLVLVPLLAMMKAPEIAALPTIPKGKKIALAIKAAKDRRVKAQPAPVHYVKPSGPQVTYVARYPLGHNAVQRLSPHNRKVYGLIAKARVNGATRRALLDALNATKSTGRVDGAVRRLRLLKVVTVRPIEA